MVSLIRITKSDRPGKKFKAMFNMGNNVFKVVHFGASGYSDYTTNHNDEKKRLYLLRHHANENWNNPTSAGALSRWILWNKPTLRESVEDFKRKFNSPQ
jgi:hypothetical protein